MINTNKLGTDFKNAYYLSEIQRKEFLDDQAMKNFVHYKKDHIGILYYLQKHLSRIISDEDVLRIMSKVYINDVPRVVKRLSLLYNKEPQRTYTSEIKDETIQKVLSAASGHYKEFHRMAKLLNTILVRPIWREDKKRFDFLILGRHYATAITESDNHHKLEEIYYTRQIEENGKTRDVRFHWTDDEYWISDEDNQRIKLEGISSEGDINPYGRIPFVELRLEDSVDYWGDGMSDYVNTIEANNAKLCDALYKQWMSFGYPIGTNLNVKADEFRIAPYNPVMVDNVRNDMAQPDLKFVTPDHQIEQDQSLIDYLRKSGGTSQGLSNSNFSNEQVEQSGYAKTIDNLELIESNNEDMPVMRDFEFNLFNMMKLELEKRSNSVKFNFDLESVEFSPYEFPKTENEIWLRREKEYQYNLSSPVDWLVEDVGISKDDAMKRIEENLAENKKIKDLERRSSIMDRLLQSTNLENENA